MNEVASTTAASDSKRRLTIGRAAAQAVDLLFYAIAASIVLKRTTGFSIVSNGLWLEALFVLTATASIILAISRVLPFQNVALAGIVIGIIGTLAYTISSILERLNVFWYANVGRPVILNAFPWHVPLTWIVIVLASRGTAQWFLSERRNTSRYGLEMMALTTILCLILTFGMQTFYLSIKAFTSSRFIFDPIDWLKFLPWTLFVWTVVTLVALVLATPMMIDKKPGSRSPNVRPLLLWSVLSFVFASAAMQVGFWPESVLMSAATVAVPILAMYKQSRSEP